MAVNQLSLMSNGWWSTSYTPSVGTPSDPVVKRIRDAVLYALRNRITDSTAAIRYTTGGETVVDTVGYHYTIREAHDPPISFGQITRYPAINVSIPHDVNAIPSTLGFEQNQGRIHNSFLLLLECFLNDMKDPAGAQDKMLADIQKYFGINYYIPDSEGNATCFLAEYDNSERWGTDPMKGKIGIDINIKVTYRQMLTDPSQKA